MVFAFRSQPLKTIYITYFALSTLFVRLPYWILTSIVPSTRPRRSWSLGRAVLVQALRATIGLFLDVGFPSLPDLNKQRKSAAELGLVWVDPVGEDLVIGEVADAAKTNGVSLTPVPGYWHGERDENNAHGYVAGPEELVLLSLHGGGYTTGSSEPGGQLMPKFLGIMSHSGGRMKRVFGLEYRCSSAAPLPAANPFPAALLDAVAGYQYLVRNLGFKPENVIVEGDSAGGHLGFTLALYLLHSKFKDLPPPGGLLLLSPTMDWACTHDANPMSSMHRNFNSDFCQAILSCGYSATALRGSLPKEELANNVYLSPSSLSLKHAPGFYNGFPPTCIIAGEAEVTLDPMRTIRDRLLADNAPEKITYHEYDGAFHDWLILPAVEPQRSQAYADIEAWINSLKGDAHLV